MIPLALQNHLEKAFGTLLSFKTASGGCINHGGIATFQHQDVFIKWNSRSKYPDMFEKEKIGLDLLRQGALKLPEVYETGAADDIAYLLLAPVHSEPPQPDFWEKLGAGLADIHRLTQEYFGLDSDNYMGSLRQFNQPNDHWINFFITQRLEPQVKLARDRQLLSSDDVALFRRLYAMLSEVLLSSPPALVHGDLWNGNVMADSHGEPVLIDPATYYGHREVDLAMTKLFGGFSHDFYEAYESTFPTEAGLHERIDIYNLYPLLVHLNLFGAGYHQQTMSIVRQFL